MHIYAFTHLAGNNPHIKNSVEWRSYARPRPFTFKNYTYINMKSASIIILLLVAFSLVSTVSFGQTIKLTIPEQRPVIPKGYYSIGNNIEKLYAGRQLLTETLSTPVINKGYYAIESNNKKLSKKPGWRNQPAPRPVSKKGYYSIGNHEPKQKSNL